MGHNIMCTNRTGMSEFQRFIGFTSDLGFYEQEAWGIYMYMYFLT